MSHNLIWCCASDTKICRASQAMRPGSICSTLSKHLHSPSCTRCAGRGWWPRDIPQIQLTFPLQNETRDRQVQGSTGVETRDRRWDQDKNVPGQGCQKPRREQSQRKTLPWFPTLHLKPVLSLKARQLPVQRTPQCNKDLHCQPPLSLRKPVSRLLYRKI